MEAKMWVSINKSRWSDGPWRLEPDQMLWIDQVTGYQCLVIRSEVTGALCGYVGVTESHPLFGKGYEDCEDSLNQFDAHGGLTFAGTRNHDLDRAAKNTDDLSWCQFWWFGFDCSHSWDHLPRLTFAGDGPDNYRTIEYVAAECGKLAASLKMLAEPHAWR